ncbi:hypothetical protein BDR07DRAFT_1483963 [Suillus spraguei]|nr:hypothetical protein BDR07DRAFT_1483963 [Suillus spraguei]
MPPLLLSALELSLTVSHLDFLLFPFADEFSQLTLPDLCTSAFVLSLGLQLGLFFAWASSSRLLASASKLSPPDGVVPDALLSPLPVEQQPILAFEEAPRPAGAQALGTDLRSISYLL